MHILLVEDNPGDARLLHEYLNDTDACRFQMVHVDRLSSGLERLAESRFDAVLLDLSLSDSCGLETLTTMRAAAKGIPIVVLTGIDDETLGLRLVQAGAQDYLVKGQVTSHLLIRSLRYAVERKRLEQALDGLLAGTASVVGQEFFSELVRHMATALHVRFALVAERVCGQSSRLRALAVWVDGAWGENFEYDIAGTPCEVVLREGSAYFPTRVCGEFPNDHDLVRLKAESYMGVVLREKSGHPIGHLCIVHDQPLTSQSRTATILAIFAARAAAELERTWGDENLRRSKASLAQAQRIAHLGNWDLDLVHNDLRWSDEIYRIFEINPAQFGASYEAFLDTVHPEDRDFVNKAYTESVRNKTVYNIVHRLLMKDGRVKHVNERCETFYDEDGTPVRSIGTVQNITERKQAEQALEELRRRTDLILTSAGEGIFGMDMEGRVTFANPAFASMLGWRSEDMLGQYGHREWHHTKPDGTPYPVKECPIHAAFRDGLVHTKKDEVFWRKDGASIPVEYVTTPLFDQGKIVGSVIVCRDITERKRVEQALRESEHAVRLAFEERERISQDLHDGILQSLYAAGMGLEAGKLIMAKTPRKAANELDRAIELLNGVVREVREFIPRLGHHPAEEFDLERALHTLVESMRGGHPELLQVNIDSAAAGRVSKEQGIQVLNIVREAVSNSLRHARAQTRSVRLRPWRKAVRVEVCDDGAGFRVSALAKRGMGLSNMTSRAVKIGGRLTIDSQPGKGTRVILDLPQEVLHGRAESKTHSPVPGR